MAHAGAAVNSAPVNTASASAKTHTHVEGIASTGTNAASGNAILTTAPSAHGAEGDANQAAQQREDDPFGQRLPDQPAGRRAERRTNRGLTAIGTRQQEIRQVRGANQQNHRGCGEQQVQRASVLRSRRSDPATCRHDDDVLPGNLRTFAFGEERSAPRATAAATW